MIEGNYTSWNCVLTHVYSHEGWLHQLPIVSNNGLVLVDIEERSCAFVTTEGEETFIKDWTPMDPHNWMLWHHFPYSGGKNYIVIHNNWSASFLRVYKNGTLIWSRDVRDDASVVDLDSIGMSPNARWIACICYRSGISEPDCLLLYEGQP